MKMLASTLLFICTLTIAALAIPQHINYQGQLTSQTETPLDTTVAMTFRLYAVESGGVPVWVETNPAVVVTDGLFNVSLGSISLVPDVFNVNSWLGITIGSDTEMIPRRQLLSVAHAYRVGTVDGANGGMISGDLIVGQRLTVGLFNSATGEMASVTGGESNSAEGSHSIVGGGEINEALGSHSTVGGGFDNTAHSTGSTVGGGRYNHARGLYSVVSGGGGVVPSDSNSAIGQFSTVGGGKRNKAAFTYATVGGGDNNTASGEYAVISGGEDQTASGDHGTVCGGYDNHASGLYSTVAGGGSNTSSGDFAFAAGQNVTAAGNNSVAIGANVSVSADSAFAWSDGSGPLFSIGSDNTFNLKANAGFRFWTTANHGDDIGARLPANSSAWTTLSDSTRKNRYGLVDAQDVLSKVCQIPIESWSYRADPHNYRHISPMAQDFWNAFHLGDDSLSISTIDPSGVLFAAVQELAKQNAEFAKENEQQTREIAELKKLVEQLVRLGNK